MKARIVKAGREDWRWYVPGTSAGCRGHRRWKDALGCLMDRFPEWKW